MSAILIRKYCQPVLDDSGYPMFYCTVDDRYNPILTIYTNCGKSFVPVHGVHFSRYKPAIEECEYAGVLLQQWMDRHVKDFEEYVDAYVEYHSLESPERIYEVDRLKLYFPRGEYKLLDVVRKFPFVDEEGNNDNFHMQYIVDIETGNLRSIGWSGRASIPPEEITTKLKFPQSVRTLIDKHVQINKEFWESQKETYKRLEAAEAKIKTCTI